MRMPILLSLASGAAGKELWSYSPATWSSVIQNAYPVGNSKLGALVFGNAGSEQLALNIDSLWSGGPFQSIAYNGGNPTVEKYTLLPGIRETIFEKGTGNVSSLLGSDDYYGSYMALGNLSITLEGVDSSSVSKYTRSLDLQSGIHTIQYATDGHTVKNQVFCSYPSWVCVYHLESTGPLPNVTVKLANLLLDAGLVSSTCTSDSVRLTGITQEGPPEGMKFDSIARLSSNSSQKVAPLTSCDNTTGVLTISSGNWTSLDFVVSGDTNYDQKKGNAASNYSFKSDQLPGPKVERLTAQAVARRMSDLRDEHLRDYSTLMNSFQLDLPDLMNSEAKQTSELIKSYNVSSGDPFLEGLLVDFSRYLLISSSRPATLPSNLLGKWSPYLTGPWSSDYHANINLQMNYWGADITGLGSVQAALWDYIQDTWVPRGSETATLLYGAPDGAWVVHDEMNIFGHTGMKSSAQWANYPAAAAWLMQHVYDHYDYSQDIGWFTEQGYPLIKGVATFWLSQIMLDGYYNDSSLVVNNCNSPEHGPTTFACTHYQQVVVQVFSYVLEAASLGVETNSNFTSTISNALARLDAGIHIGGFGEIKEWKIPDSYGYDIQNDTHRHLSHLVGWFPGSSISALAGGYSNQTIQNAVATSLRNRGNGNGPDGNAGWEKVWRSACWARLNNTDEADYELRYAINQNFAPNGFSMYSGTSTPFQIDANFGLGGAVLSMLAVDMATPGVGYNGLAVRNQEPEELRRRNVSRVVVLGPAIPSRWGSGSVKGMRLRGGGSVDFAWNDKGVVTKAAVVSRSTALTLVNKAGDVLVTV